MRALLERQSDDHALLAAELQQKRAEAEELRAALLKAKEVIDLQEATYRSKEEGFQRQMAGLQKAVKASNKASRGVGGGGADGR
jgi:hypothetical protein